MERTCAGPRMIYPQEASDIFDCQKREPRRLFTELGRGLDQRGASDQTSGRFTEDLHCLPKKKEKPVEKRRIEVQQVHEVVAITFWDKYLNESVLEVKYEFEGERKKGNFNYDEIRDLDGTQSAVKKFRPLFTEEKAR